MHLESKGTMGKKLYHKSNPIFRKSILKNGLLPKVGECYSLYWEDKTDEELVPYIFMYDKDICDYDSTYDDDIYEIDVDTLNKDHIKLDMCPTLVGCYVYDLPIPITSIKLIHKGSGKSW